MKKEFTIRFFFTSSRADGEGYTRDRKIVARNQDEACNMARIIGFEEFGARFADNCFDWLVTP